MSPPNDAPGSGAAPMRERRTVATYERVIKASIARIWENVLDWEHLPWLHSGSFASIQLEREDETGWRAAVGVGPRGFASQSQVEVRLDRPNACYTTATLAGLGAGTEIHTRLVAVGEHATAIAVEFVVPDLTDEDVEGVGAIYLDLYRQLWDEDEVMMIHRQRVLDEQVEKRTQAEQPATIVALGPQAQLRERLPLIATVAGRRYRIVEIDGDLVAHDVVCPHRGGPLEDQTIEDGCVTCPWHGYRFDLRSGEGRDGCGFRLAAAPRIEIDPVTSEVRLAVI